MKKTLILLLIVLGTISAMADSADNNKFWTKLKSDLRYFKKSDAVRGYTAVQVDSISENYKKYDILQSSGSTCKTVTKFCSLTDKLAITISDAAMLLIEMEVVPYQYTFTSVRYWPSVTGSYTFDNNNKIGLYKLVGTTFTLVASTTNNTSLWTVTANTPATATFITPYIVPANEKIFAAMLLNVSVTTTAVNFYGGSCSGDLRFDNVAPFFGTTYPFVLQKISQTDLPSSFDINTCIRASAIPLLIGF